MHDVQGRLEEFLQCFLLGSAVAGRLRLTLLQPSRLRLEISRRKRQCCGSKYIEFGSGSRILAQFGSGSRVILSILKEKIQIILEKNNFF